MMPGFGLVPLEGTFGPLAPSHWSEFVVGLVLAVLIAVAVQKLVVPRFEQMYAQRSDEIEGGIRRSEQAQLEAQQQKDEYQALMAKARSDAASMREDAKAQGATLIEQARAQGQKEADRLVEQAKAQIEAERAAAYNSLRSEVGGLATTLAGRIVGESLAGSQAANRTVDRFLADLADQPARTGSATSPEA